MIFLNQAGRVEGAVMDQAALVEPCDLGSRVEQRLQTHDGCIFLLKQTYFVRCLIVFKSLYTALCSFLSSDVNLRPRT